MKKLLFVAGLFATLGASAQYSQWTYGMGNFGETEQASNGHVLRTTGPGHIMAGPHNSFGGRTAYVVKNDADGKSLAAPYFNNSYTIVHPSGVSLDVRECKVTEFMNGSGYGVAGIYDDPSTFVPGLFYMRLDIMGNVIAGPFIYEPTPNPNTAAITFGNIRENSMGTELYLIGGIVLPNLGQYRPYIHKIDQNGNIIWSNVYAIFDGVMPSSQAFDAVEDPASSVLAVVGLIDRYLSRDAFFYRVDPVTGNPFPVGIAQVYGNDASVDELYSICYSTTTITGAPGWLVCGKSNQNTMGGDFDAWIMSLDIAGGTLWSQLSNGISTIPADNQANQIIERRNYAGIFEFYTAGTMDNGPLGGRDMEVFKGDVSGVFTSHFAYGGSQDEYGWGLDDNNVAGATDEGLAVFGSTETFTILGGARNDYFVKAYFNGLSGCNEDINTPFTYGGPIELTRLDYYYYDQLIGNPGFATWQNGNEFVLCHNPTIAGGDNSLKATVKGQDLATADIKAGTPALVITPNPVNQDASTIQLELTAPAGTMEVIVADYMGRQYVNQRFDIRDGGRQTLSVELAKANLAPGMYLMRVNGLDKPVSQVLIVK